VRRLVIFALVAVALLGAAAAGYSYLDRRFREWNERVEAVQEFSRAETARADSLAAIALEMRLRADSLASLPSVVDTIHVDSIIAAAPDTCAPVVAIVEALVIENQNLRDAYDLQRSAADKLQLSYDALLVVNDSLMTVLDDRPIPPPEWIPSFRVGPFAGVCSSGTMCVGVGVSISWKVPIL